MKDRYSGKRVLFRIVGSAVIGIVITAASTFAQAIPDSEPTFDVASIKPSIPGTRQLLTIQPGGRLVVNNFSLKVLVGLAYHLQGFQLADVDNSMSTDQWSIEAKADDISVIPPWAPPYIPEVIAVRLRSLLKERFLLKTHSETRNLQVYTLVVDKSGPKLAAVDSPSHSSQEQHNGPATQAPLGSSNGSRTPPPGSFLAGPGAIVGSAVTMNQIITILSRFMDRPLIDRTGLTAFYNVRLQFAPDSAPRMLSKASPSVDGSSAESLAANPSIFVALQEQLGLKLESKQEPVEILLIVSDRKTTEN